MTNTDTDRMDLANSTNLEALTVISSDCVEGYWRRRAQAAMKGNRDIGNQKE